MTYEEDVSQPRHVDRTEHELQSPQVVAAEMAQAFQELARGEKTASALEKQLDGIESRIDELLAAAEAAVDSQKLAGTDMKSTYKA